ncbi:MAG: DUF6273 domain-containing protein [Treponema sp.]|jgi:hypothetical protein|nr:DUF6273 domain-containing protein [Treponema sp.]
MAIYTRAASVRLSGTFVFSLCITLLAGGCLDPIAYVPYDAAIPDIIVQPEGFSCSKGADPQELVVEAAASDGGSISYQWYTYADSNPSRVTLNPGSVCRPITDTKGIHYYYAEVTNYNPNRQNKTAVRESVHAKVIVDMSVVSSLDLTGVIPAPVSGEEPKAASSYSGEYTVGSIQWTDITGGGIGATPPVFTLGHTYRAAFTLYAGSDRCFAGLPVGTGSDPYAGTWTAGEEPSETNFYHLDASTVVQALNLDSTIQIIITFMPAQGIAVSSLDLTGVIPAPAAGAAVASSTYSGEYTVGAVTWTDISAAPLTPVNPVAAFAAGHTYSAGFTLSAAANRSFEGLPVGTGSEPQAGTWTAGLSKTPSATNFYHRGAVSVVQSANTGVTIDITITFTMTLELSGTPQGSGVVTAIDAEVTKVYFTLDNEYSGTWKVYTAAAGGTASAALSASFSMVNNMPILTLKSASPISPRAYYVSVTEAGKGESGRLALWGPPLDDTTPLSLAARFRIPETALPSGAGGVYAVFTLLHTYIGDVVDKGEVNEDNGYAIPAIALGDWVDLQSLTVLAYDGDGGFSVTNDEVPDHGRLLRLLVVGNNSFNTDRAQAIGGDYNPADDIKTHNNGTPHLVFQFQNLFDARRMNGSGNDGYFACDIRDYLNINYITGLTNAGLPAGCLFAPIQYTLNATNSGITRITDEVWLPTMRELFWNDPYVLANGHIYDREIPEDQPRLEYYTDNDTRKKGKLDAGADYTWTASTHHYGSNDGFCVFDASTGTIASYPDDGSNAANAMWVCPAFCVK